MADANQVKKWLSDEEAVPFSLRQRGNSPLQLFRGPENKVKLVNFEDGRLFVTTDTKKIYLDSYVEDLEGNKQEKRLSLGGNNGIYYGQREFNEVEQSGTFFYFLYDVNSEFHSFDSSAEDVPQKNDLILNSDGCFYRVTSVGPGIFTTYEEDGEDLTPVEHEVENLITAIKLTIAGGGGGGGTGGSTLTIRRNPDHNGNILLAEGSLTLGFYVTDTNPDSERVQVDVTIRNNYTIQNLKRIRVNTNELQTVDLYRYRDRFVTNAQNIVTIKVTNDFGASATFSYTDIRPIELMVRAVGSTTLEPVRQPSATITTIPMGGSAMWRWDMYYDLHIPGVDDIRRYIVEDMDSSQYDNNQPFQKVFDLSNYGTGSYSVDVWMRAYPDQYDVDDNGNIKYLESTPITLSFVYTSGDQPNIILTTDKNAYNQYERAVITYQAIYLENSVIRCKLTAYCNDDIVAELQPSINEGETKTWVVDLRKGGTYRFRIDAVDFAGVYDEKANIEVKASTETVPTINDADEALQIYYTAEGKDSADIENRGIWLNRGRAQGIVCDFKNFNWNTNGWQVDEDNVTMLHMTNGAQLTIPYAVFSKANSGNKDNGAIGDGKTIELDFKLTNVRDVDAILINIASWQNGALRCGIVGIGDKICFNTNLLKNYRKRSVEQAMTSAEIAGTNGLRAYITEGIRIHVAFTVEPANTGNNLIYTYIDGVLSGLTEYAPDSDTMVDVGNIQEQNSFIRFDSTAADIDIYNIRVYNQYNTDTIMLNNYEADLPDPTSRITKQKDNAVLAGGAISLGLVADLGNIPYIVFTDGRATDSKKGEILDTDGNKIGYGPKDASNPALPIGKKDFRWAPFYYVDPEDAKHENDSTYIKRSIGSPNNLVEGVIYAQGTSSLQYPVKNLRLRIADSEQPYSLKPSIPEKEGSSKWEHVPPVQLFCFKTDYMESAMAHNTGTGNVLTALYDSILLKTPAQIERPDDTLVTAVVGHPCIAFFQPHNSNIATYIGRYNFNLDKGEHEPFGFVPNYDTLFGVVIDNWENYTDKATRMTRHAVSGFQATTDESKNWDKKKLYDKTYYTAPDENALWNGNHSDNAKNMKNYFKRGPLYEHKSGESSKDFLNSIQCWEFLNNTSNLCRFAGEWDEATDISYKVQKDGEGNPIHDSEGNPVYELDDDGNKIIDEYMPYWVGSFESRYPEYETQQCADKRGFLRLVHWIASTDQNRATNNPIPQVIYNGVPYTTDSRAYRLAKFVNEFPQYMVKDFTLFYYIITEALLLVDSRSKNMMMCSFNVDADHNSGLWFPIFYDMDTALGVDNSGVLKFAYDVDDATDFEAFNGRANYGRNVVENGQTVWVPNPAYNTLWANVREGFADDIAVLYRRLRAGDTFNVNALLKMYNDQQADKFAEIYDNKDAYYKYIRPLTEETTVTIDGKDITQVGINWIQAAQGTRSLHRNYLLNKRFQMLDGKYSSGSVADITFRLNGPTILDINQAVGNDYSYHPDPHSRQFNVISSSTQYVGSRYVNNSNLMIKKVPAGQYVRTDIPGHVPEETFTNTEAYLYNLGDIYDIGDLSDKYATEITINTDLKLRKLTVGNPSPLYRIQSSIATKIQGLDHLPLLEELDIQNARLGTTALSVAKAEYFTTLKAKGSNLSSITLPIGGNLKRLELPASLESLKVINNIFFDNKTDPSNFQIEGFKALDAEGVLQPTLHDIEIEGCPDFNTQQLLTDIRAQDDFILKSGDVRPNTPQLDNLRLPDLNWTFEPTAEDCILDNEGIITDVKLLRYIAQVVGHDPWKETFHGTETRELIGNLTLAGTVRINNGTNDDPDHVGIDIMSLKRHYEQAFPHLVITYDDNDLNISGYQINIHDNGTELVYNDKGDGKQNSILLDGTQANGFDFLNYLTNNVSYPVLAEDNQCTYEFAGWSYRQYSAVWDTEPETLALLLDIPVEVTIHNEGEDNEYRTMAPDVGDKTTLTPADFGEFHVIDLYPVFIIHKRIFDVFFYKYPKSYAQNELNDQQRVAFGDFATAPANVPIIITLDPEDISHTTISKFIKYERNDGRDTFQINGVTYFYPTFESEADARSIHDPETKYFEVTEVPASFTLWHGPVMNGICATIREDCTAEAIVVPLTIDARPVITLQNKSTHVKRIYFERDRESNKSNIKFFGTFLSNQPIAGGFQRFEKVTVETDFGPVTVDQSVPNQTLEFIDFAACTELHQIGNPDRDANGVFGNCVKLHGSELPDNLTYIALHTFENCSELNFTKLPKNLVYIGDYAFATSGLASLDVSQMGTTATQLLTQLNESADLTERYPHIGDYAFINCTNLVMGAPTTGSYQIQSIGNGAFQGCTSLEMFSEDAAATRSYSLRAIGEHAFYQDKNLNLLFIPDNVGVIGESAFELGTNRNRVPVLFGSLPPYLEYLGSNAFAYTYMSPDSRNGRNLSWDMRLITLCPEIEEDSLANCWAATLSITLNREASYVTVNSNNFYSLPASITSILDVNTAGLQRIYLQDDSDLPADMQGSNYTEEKAIAKRTPPVYAHWYISNNLQN